MHHRRYILEELADQLRTLDGFGAVRIQRIGPAKNLFPSITLFADSEECQTISVLMQPRPQDRRLTVSVQAWIRGTVDTEKAELDMDNAAVQIEKVMDLPDKADTIELIATDFTVAEDDPEVHVVTLTYRLTYNTTEFDPVI